MNLDSYDSNGDGIGDLPGITSKSVPHLVDPGFEFEMGRIIIICSVADSILIARLHKIPRGGRHLALTCLRISPQRLRVRHLVSPPLNNALLQLR
jgi:hypothetical protein